MRSKIKTERVIKKIGKILIKFSKAKEVKWISRCPAVIFAVNRTPNANGRIKMLIDSIRIRKGERIMGVPSGRRWANEWSGCFLPPRITVPNHNGMARDILIESWVVKVKV